MGVGLGRSREHGVGRGCGCVWVCVCPCRRPSQRSGPTDRAHPSPHAPRFCGLPVEHVRREAQGGLKPYRTGPHQPPPYQRRIGVHPPERLQPRRRHSVMPPMPYVFDGALSRLAIPHRLICKLEARQLGAQAPPSIPAAPSTGLPLLALNSGALYLIGFTDVTGCGGLVLELAASPYTGNVTSPRSRQATPLLVGTRGEERGLAPARQTRTYYKTHTQHTQTKRLRHNFV
jgi:hypothetical protein